MNANRWVRWCPGTNVLYQALTSLLFSLNRLISTLVLMWFVGVHFIFQQVNIDFFLNIILTWQYYKYFFKQFYENLGQIAKKNQPKGELVLKWNHLLKKNKRVTHHNTENNPTLADKPRRATACPWHSRHAPRWVACRRRRWVLPSCRGRANSRALPSALGRRRSVPCCEGRERAAVSPGWSSLGGGGHALSSWPATHPQLLQLKWSGW